MGTEKNISTSEVTGHIRKMHRELKMFERAIEIADELDAAAKNLKSIKSEVEFLQGDLKGLKEEIEDGEKELADCLEKRKAVESEIELTLKKADAQIEEKAKVAQRESDKLVNGATSRLKNLSIEIKALSDERNKALQDKKEADEQLRAVNAQIKQTKEKFIESL